MQATQVVREVMNDIRKFWHFIKPQTPKSDRVRLSDIICE